MSKKATWLLLLIMAVALGILAGCNSDEQDLNPPPPGRETIALTFDNPIAVEVNSERHWALLLHSESPALQLVDLANHSVIKTLILDYYDVYDVKFLPGSKACFAGRPQGNRGYAVRFFSLPDLTLGTEVMTAPLEGEHGYLAVDTVGRMVYYSLAGGGSRDGLYRISYGTEQLSDADASPAEPHGFDNELVQDLFSHPGRIAFDYATRRIIVANTGDNYVTYLDAALWGALARDGSHSFPITGTTHLSTISGADSVNAQAMCGSQGVYAFAGTQNDGTAFLSRFTMLSNGLDRVNLMPGTRSWRFRNADVCLHMRPDIYSVFVLERDTTRWGIGQYRLNDLELVDGSPYRTEAIADSNIAAVGIDTLADKLVVADARHPVLELVNVRRN